MNTRGRIILLGLSVLVIIVVVVVVVVGGGSSTTYTTDNPVLTGSSVVDMRFKKGDTVKFRVDAPIDTEVHVHGYNIMKDVKKGEVAQFSFPATIDGEFVVEFEETSQQIAQLRVDP